MRNTKTTLPIANQKMCEIVRPAKVDIVARDTTRYFTQTDPDGQTVTQRSRCVTIEMPATW